MENKLLYLAGGMSGLSRDEQWQWRKDVRTKLLEDVLGLERYNLFKPNAAIFEQQETQRLVNQAQEDLQMEAAVPQDITS